MTVCFCGYSNGAHDCISMLKLRVKELESLVKQYESEDEHEAMSCYMDHKENAKLRKALTAIVIHGQHPGYDNNWAVYVLDLANNALKN